MFTDLLYVLFGFLWASGRPNCTFSLPQPTTQVCRCIILQVNLYLLELYFIYLVRSKLNFPALLYVYHKFLFQ